MESVRANEPVIEKVANWFKDIFNVCGNSSCCGSKNPYHDKQVWDDINERISYKVPKGEEQENPKKKKRHTELQPYNENSIIEERQSKKGRYTQGSKKKKKSKKHDESMESKSRKRAESKENLQVKKKFKKEELPFSPERQGGLPPKMPKPPKQPKEENTAAKIIGNAMKKSKNRELII
jgi:hypothetical protein